MRIRALSILLGAILTSACAEVTSNEELVMAPERYSLSAAERAVLKEGIDVEALERLVATIPPAHRAGFLRFWRADFRGGIVDSEDPGSAALLRQVWAPQGGAIPNVPAERLYPPYQRPVELVLVPELDDPRAGALVIREAAGGRDVIVLSEAYADAIQLDVAKVELESDRRTSGPVPEKERRLVVGRLPDSHPGDEGALRAKNVLEQRYKAQLSALRSAPVEEIQGLGRGRRIVMIAPSGQGRP